MLQVESSFIKIGIQNLECAIFPPGSNKEAIPLDATFNTIFPVDLIAADNVLQMKVFPVPP